MPTNYDPSPFVCPACSWIVGEKYRKHNRRFTTLRVFRQPRAPGSNLVVETAPLHERFSTIDVYQSNVLCGHCGAVVPWNASGDALNDMLLRAKSRSYGLAD